MTQEGALPPDFWQQIDRRIDQKVAAASRAASIRNASISSGGTFSITGGAFVFKADDGTSLTYMGPVLPTQLDGSAQPGLLFHRADDTVVMAMYDAAPGVGGVLNQALNWFDRQGGVVFADDTNSGQGLARPYIPVQLFPASLSGSTQTSATSFSDLWVGVSYHQHPRLYVQVAAGNTVSGATGQVQVVVNGSVWGAPQNTSSTTAAYAWGPAVLAGDHMSGITVEVQAKMTSGTGNVQVVPRACIGMQS